MLRRTPRSPLCDYGQEVDVSDSQCRELRTAPGDYSSAHTRLFRALRLIRVLCDRVSLERASITRVSNPPSWIILVGRPV